MRRDLLAHLFALIRERLRHGQPVLVAIDGAAGLGKTTLARELRDAFPGKATVLHTDDYLTERPARRGITAYDHRAIRLDDLRRDTHRLRQRDITVRHYDHATGTHGRPTVIPSRPVVIVEGAHALNPTLDRDIGVFIDAAEDDMRVLRRRRDINERAARPEAFDEWWPQLHDDYRRYVQPNRENAAVVIAASR